MSYEDIFVLGWNLNALMFFINIFVAINVFSSADPQKMQEHSDTLKELNIEFEKYYPNKRWESLLSYAIPFTAFYKILFRFVEMWLFFRKNSGTKIYDFMIYKYQRDIQKAQNLNKD